MLIEESILPLQKKPKHFFMKRILLCCVVLFMATISSVIAQQPTTSTTTIEQPLSRLHITGSKNRPRTIVPMWIDCYYNNGEMTFEASDILNNINVTITSLNNGYNYSFNINNSDCPIYIDLDSGSYRIVCISNECEYEGVIDIF